MTRIVHIVPSVDPNSGGPARSVPALCSAQAQAGADVSLVSFGSPGIEVPQGVDVISMRPFPSTRQGLTVAALKTMRAAISGADLVHVHSLWNPPVSAAQSFARARDIPYVISPRGMLQSVSLSRKRWLKRLVGALGERKKIAEASGIHFLTPDERDSSSAFGTLPTRVLVLPNGVDLDLRGAIAPGGFFERWPALEDRKIILFLGRLHWSKGLDVQAEAVIQLARDRDDFTWVLIGPDEGAWKDLSRTIARSGIEERVVWLGPQPHDVCLQAIRAAHVMAITSKHEAHSMAMNEALALGAPLVMTESVGFAGLARAGAALQVGSDGSEVARALGRAIDDRLLSTELSEAGTRFARETLSWPVLARKMLDFYAEVITGVGPSPAR